MYLVFSWYMSCESSNIGRHWWTLYTLFLWSCLLQQQSDLIVHMCEYNKRKTENLVDMGYEICHSSIPCFSTVHFLITSIAHICHTVLFPFNAQGKGWRCTYLYLLNVKATGYPIIYRIRYFIASSIQHCILSNIFKNCVYVYMNKCICIYLHIHIDRYTSVSASRKCTYMRLDRYLLRFTSR